MSNENEQSSAVALAEPSEELPSPSYAPLPKSAYRDLGNEEWHSPMQYVEEWERIRVAGFQRLIVSSERAAEIQRRQPYSDVGRPICISTGGASRWTVPKKRIPKKLHKKSEKQLAEYGLSLQQLKLQETQPVFVPKRSDPAFDRYAFDGRALNKGGDLLRPGAGIFSALDSSDLFRGETKTVKQLAYHAVKTRQHERDIPDWVYDDSRARAVLLKMYPKLQMNEGHRERARVAWTVLYRYFRQLDHPENIAEDLGLNNRQVEYIVAKARKAGEDVFSTDFGVARTDTIEVIL